METQLSQQFCIEAIKYWAVDNKIKLTIQLTLYQAKLYWARFKKGPTENTYYTKSADIYVNPDSYETLSYELTLRVFF